MGKIAFLYPGQGSQKVGMGKELLQEAPELFSRYLMRSDAVTGMPVTQYCLEGPFELLSQTHITQPALFAHSLALTEYAHRVGLHPHIVAGHSLGEYTAAVAAGVLSFEDGLSLVSERGKIMYRIQDEQPGAMAAIVGLTMPDLQQLCVTISREHLVEITNWNTYTQFVVSGVKDGVLALMEAASACKNVKAIRLKVRGAFHSSLMAPVQSALSDVMCQLSWHDARVPLVANVSGELIASSEQIRQELNAQITHPVQWVNCVETLLAAGCDTFVELSPSQVLTRLVRSIAPESKAFVASSPKQLATLAATLNIPAHI